MKTTVIPAQITSVEDKIAGNLSFIQILLFLGALFVSTVLYLIFPPQFKFSPLKLALIGTGTVVLLILAVRIKEKIILEWIRIIATYSLRGKYFVFNKNDETLRNVVFYTKQKKEMAVVKQINEDLRKESVAVSDVLALQRIIGNRNVRFAFKKKGGMHVSVS